MRRHWLALAIIAVYTVLGSLYALGTPIWQAPDEPAHYNYVRALAAGGGFPEMAAGDYDQALLSELTTRRFPPELSVASLEYEDHQPPLYYLLQTPVYWAFGGSVVALRLGSVLLGGGAVAMVMLILSEFCHGQLSIVWLGGGLVAFIPQYVAITASVNNDALLLLLLWLWLWLALRYLRGRVSPWTLGALAGAVLLTKSTGYGVLLLIPLVAYLRYRRAGMDWRWLARQLAAMIVPAVFLGGIWWVRNVAVYGWPDVMGLRQHDAVVVGQPETIDAIADQGFWPFLRDGVVTVFRSFWGQFGWMGVVIDRRIYQGLAIASGLTTYGALWQLVEGIREGLGPRQRDGLITLGIAASITVVLFLGYNLTFVQHQGRYLFPALPLLALGSALGWRRLMEKRLAIVSAAVLAVLALAMALLGLAAGDLPLWPLAMLGAAAAALPAMTYVPARFRVVVGAGALAGLVALDLWCLYGFIIPMLTR